MISKTVDIGQGWKVRMRWNKTDGTLNFEKYNNKLKMHDGVQIFNDTESMALTEFWKFVKEIKQLEEEKIEV